MPRPWAVEVHVPQLNSSQHEDSTGQARGISRASCLFCVSSKHEDSTGQARGISRASCLFFVSSHMKAPRGKPVASCARRASKIATPVSAREGHTIFALPIQIIGKGGIARPQPLVLEFLSANCLAQIRKHSCKERLTPNGYVCSSAGK